MHFQKNIHTYRNFHFICFACVISFPPYSIRSFVRSFVRLLVIEIKYECIKWIIDSIMYNASIYRWMLNCFVIHEWSASTTWTYFNRSLIWSDDFNVAQIFFSRCFLYCYANGIYNNIYVYVLRLYTFRYAFVEIKSN